MRHEPCFQDSESKEKDQNVQKSLGCKLIESLSQARKKKKSSSSDEPHPKASSESSQHLDSLGQGVWFSWDLTS